LFGETQQDYYTYRALDLQCLSESKRAALFIYLNRTCYRGVFRVNLAGKFNVPFGAYRNRPVFRKGELERTARLLAGSKLIVGDFEDSVSSAKKGDFVYFDPPYFQMDSGQGFVRYNADQFTLFDHLRLRDCCQMLDRRGVSFALSHVENPFILDLYKGLKVKKFSGKWHISSKSDDRFVSELLIKNY